MTMSDLIINKMTSRQISVSVPQKVFKRPKANKFHKIVPKFVVKYPKSLSLMIRVFR